MHNCFRVDLVFKVDQSQVQIITEYAWQGNMKALGQRRL